MATPLPSTSDDGRAALTLSQAIQHAATLLGAGSWTEAEQLCKSILAVSPDHFQALHLLGVIALETRRFPEALHFLSRAAAFGPDDAAVYNNHAVTLQALGRFEEALASCVRALEIAPDYAEAHYNAGNALIRLQRYENALEAYHRAVHLKPGYADAHYNSGIILQKLDRFEAALDSYDNALRIRPQYAAALYNRGVTLQNLGRRTEALDSYERALRSKPDLAEAHHNRGVTLAAIGRFDEALQSYAQALRLRPDYASAHTNCGLTLAALRRCEEALASHDRALQIKPDNADAHNNRGVALESLGRYEEAAHSYDSALQIEPDHAEAHNNRGNVLRELNRPEEALVSYERALKIKPDCQWLYGQWLGTRMRLCDWAGVVSGVNDLLSAVAQGKQVTPPLVVLTVSDSLALQRRAAEIWMKETCPTMASGVGPPATRLESPAALVSRPRIRVAYLSGDFRDHPVAQLLTGVLERHDRERFEVIAVGLQPTDHSALGQRVRSAADQFIDVSRQSDESVAQWLRRSEVDIVVDLQGITQGMRAQILSRRPAGIQVNYLGFPATMGASYIDYIIGDEVVIPAGAEEHYSESMVRLPHSFLPFDDAQGIAEELPTREQAGLPASGFVFCDFNNHIKITPVIFEVWMKWLRGIPGSCLWLRWAQGKVQENLRREAQARGVQGERIIFAGKVPTLEEHLSRQRLADLFVDTLPYNAHATAAQALWAGVPVLTCQGASFAGRVASSLLTAVGLPELITEDLSAYERVGFELAREPQRLVALRERLAATRCAAPLFDTATYTRHLEAAYQLMIERHRRGLPPTHLRVSHPILQ